MSDRHDSSTNKLNTVSKACNNVWPTNETHLSRILFLFDMVMIAGIQNIASSTCALAPLSTACQAGLLYFIHDFLLDKKLDCVLGPFLAMNEFLAWINAFVLFILFWGRV
jgi:hypothetical protein